MGSVGSQITVLAGGAVTAHTYVDFGEGREEAVNRAATM
jgi:hypothetical protein